AGARFTGAGAVVGVRTSAVVSPVTSTLPPTVRTIGLLYSLDRSVRDQRRVAESNTSIVLPRPSTKTASLPSDAAPRTTDGCGSREVDHLPLLASKISTRSLVYQCPLRP